MLTLILHTGYAHSKLLTIIYKDQMGQYWRTSLLLCLITVVHFLVAPPEKLQKRYIKRKKKWGEKFIPCKRKGCVYQTSPKESLGFVVSYTESNSLTSKNIAYTIFCDEFKWKHNTVYLLSSFMLDAQYLYQKAKINPGFTGINCSATTFTYARIS